jgi:hypothetical protein
MNEEQISDTFSYVGHLFNQSDLIASLLLFFLFLYNLQNFSIISSIQNILQVDRLQRLYPATCPVEIVVTWPCPALP